MFTILCKLYISVMNRGKKEQESIQLTLEGRVFAGICDTSTPILTDTLLATHLTPISATLSTTFDSLYGKCTMTPDLSNLSLGPKRGWPRGDSKKPTFDDFPVNGTDSEKERWFKAKKVTRMVL